MSAEEEIHKDVPSPMEEDDEEEEEEDEEEALLAKLKQIDEQLAADPYKYDAHVDKISVLKELAELDQLRQAREAFALCYPLAPDLWLAWLKDEQNLAATEEEKADVASLFERAVKDYVSVDVWLEYCQFSLGGIGTLTGVERARAVFENAVAAVGLHVSRGALIWEAYREFEAALLSLTPADDAEKREAQRAKVDKVFQRQLTVPLFDMDQTLAEYEQWLEQEGRQAEKNVELNYKKARKMLQEREEFESSLLQTAGAEAKEKNLEAYQSYLDYEVREGLPVRIQLLHERQLTDHCLTASVWQNYLRYLSDNIKIDTVLLSVHERSVRNCPWDGDLWARYIRSLERYEQPHETVIKVFEQSLAGGGECLKPWMAYLDYTRRSMTLDDEEDQEKFEKERQKLRDLFERALVHLVQVSGDPECQVARYWASVEADRFRSMEEARKIWSDVLKVVGDQARYCLEYISLEKLYGETKKLRRLFPRLLECCSDRPAWIAESWLQFEREEGSLQQFEEAEAKVQKCYAKICEAENKVSEQGLATDTKKREKVEKKKEKDKQHRRDKRHMQAEEKRKGKKRRADDGACVQGDEEQSNGEPEFKVPKLPASASTSTSVAHPPGYKSESVAPPPGFKEDRVAPPPGYKGDSVPPPHGYKENSVAPPPGFKKDNVAPPPGYKGDGSVAPPPGYKGDGSVAPPPGYKGDDSVAPPPGYKGDDSVAPPPGYKGDTAQQPPAGVGEDGQFVHDDRPEALLKRVFLSNLLFTVTESEIYKVMGASGRVVDVRLAKNPSGKSKGFAYVDFSTAEEAQAAIARDRELLHDRPMFVAPCEPNKKGHTFQYPVGLEKSKLFVKDLPLTFDQEKVEKLFVAYGRIKEVRAVTYRNGKFKGIAFVEFETEAEAGAALMKSDGMQVEGKKISVALSNPPARGKRAPEQQQQQKQAGASLSSHLGGRGGATKSEEAPRGRLAFVPRAVKKATAATQPKPAAKEASDKKEETASNAPSKSNQDFRTF